MNSLSNQFLYLLIVDKIRLGAVSLLVSRQVQHDDKKFNGSSTCSITCKQNTIMIFTKYIYTLLYL